VQAQQDRVQAWPSAPRRPRNGPRPRRQPGPPSSTTGQPSAIYLLKVAVESTAGYERFLREKLYRIPGIRHRRSSFTLQRADWVSACPSQTRSNSLAAACGFCRGRAAKPAKRSGLLAIASASRSFTALARLTAANASRLYHRAHSANVTKRGHPRTIASQKMK